MPTRMTCTSIETLRSTKTDHGPSFMAGDHVSSLYGCSVSLYDISTNFAIPRIIVHHMDPDDHGIPFNHSEPRPSHPCVDKL